MGETPGADWGSLEDLRRLTRGALAEMRGLLVELQPLALIDSELEDLLRFLGNALTGRTNMPPRLVICETIRELLPLFPPAQAVG